MTVTIYKRGDEACTVESDLACEFPIYMYIFPGNESVAWSTSASSIFSYVGARGELKISESGISFFLQNGLVPPPNSIYENLHILSVGDKAEINTIGNRISVSFVHEFPFLNKGRLYKDDMQPDINWMLKMLAESTVSRMNRDRPTFLFHSAGKDSNSIALALAEAGLQSKIDLVTHKSKGRADESEISKSIAKRLGFRHHIVHEMDSINSDNRNSIRQCVSKMPFPCADSVMLAYPLYTLQLPELCGANLIDGGGNDAYMGVPPTNKEVRRFLWARFGGRCGFLRGMVSSESIFMPLIKTPAEWCGMTLLSWRDSKTIFPHSTDTYPYWNGISQRFDAVDVFDFKTDILTSIVASEQHIRKVRNFAHAVDGNLILPWANAHLAEYFSRMPEIYLFDRQSKKNKIFIRTMLKEKIALDSDSLGKMVYSFDLLGLVKENMDWIKQEIFLCNLWSARGAERLISRLARGLMGSGFQAKVSAKMLYRIFILSVWMNTRQL